MAHNKIVHMLVTLLGLSFIVLSTCILHILLLLQDTDANMPRCMKFEGIMC